MKTKLLLLFVLSLCAKSLWAVDRIVDANLSTGNGSTMFNTIASAISAAQNGDRVLIVGNTYNESSLNINKSLKILPFAPGTIIYFNQNVTISGFPGMKLSITGLNIGNYSFYSAPIIGGVASNRASVSIINCTTSDFVFADEFYDFNIIENTVANGILFAHGDCISNNSKFIVLVEESQNDLNTSIKNAIINNTVSYLVGVYNNDYPLIIANNKLRDLSVIRWNANVSVSNKIINNDFYNDATLNFSSVGAPYYNFIFSSNNFLGSFVGVSASGCWPNNSNLNGNYNQAPSYFNYDTWFPTWGWCCNGPNGWYYINGANNPTRPPNFNCYTWTTGGSTQWPNFNSNGFFEWSYNGVNFVGSPTTATTLNFTKIIGPANVIDGGKPAHDYYDIDLTINDRGITGGPYSINNYNPTINLSNGKAFIFDLDMPTDLFPGQQVDIKAKGYHKN